MNTISPDKFINEPAGLLIAIASKNRGRLPRCARNSHVLSTPQLRKVREGLFSIM